MKKYYLAFILLSGYSTTAQKLKTITNTPVAKEKWNTYKDTINKFSFIYPSNWTIRIADSTEKAKVFVRSPEERDYDQFIENVNVLTRKLTDQKIPINDLKKAILDAYKKSLKDFNLINEKITKSNDVDAYQVEYLTTQSTESKALKIKVLQFIFVKNYYLYTITYTAIHDAPIDYYNNAVKIIGSFKIIK